MQSTKSESFVNEVNCRSTELVNKILFAYFAAKHRLERWIWLVDAVFSAVQSRRMRRRGKPNFRISLATEYVRIGRKYEAIALCIRTVLHERLAETRPRSALASSQRRRPLLAPLPKCLVWIVISAEAAAAQYYILHFSGQKPDPSDHRNPTTITVKKTVKSAYSGTWLLIATGRIFTDIVISGVVPSTQYIKFRQNFVETR